MFGSSITRTRTSFKGRGLFVARKSGVMTRCTRSVCLASSGRLAGDRDVCCGAGRRDEPVSSAQPVVTPARMKTAIVRENLIASPSSAQATSMANRLAIIPKKTVQLKSFAIEKSPLDSDVIALAEPPKAIDIRSPSVEGDRMSCPGSLVVTPRVIAIDCTCRFLLPRWQFESDGGSARFYHVQSFCRRPRKIDDPIFCKRSAIGNLDFH